MVGSLAAPPFVASCSLLPLPDDSTQVIASKLRRKRPCFAILHDPWLPVSSNAGNETMTPSLLDLLAPLLPAFPPLSSPWTALDGGTWARMCRRMSPLLVPEYQMPARMNRRMSPLLDGARISNAGWFPPLLPFPSHRWVIGVGGRQLGPGCALKTCNHDCRLSVDSKLHSRRGSGGRRSSAAGGGVVWCTTTCLSWEFLFPLCFQFSSGSAMCAQS